MRLFIGIELENNVRRVLNAALESIGKTSLKGIKLTRPENLHVTLNFLGDVTEERLNQLSILLREVALSHSDFEFRLGSLGRFPKLGPIRVVWCGLEPKDPLIALANDLAKAVHEIGVRLEERE